MLVLMELLMDFLSLIEHPPNYHEAMSWTGMEMETERRPPWTGILVSLGRTCERKVGGELLQSNACANVQGRQFTAGWKGLFLCW